MATGWATSTSAPKTAAYYREQIELPFFLYYLKGRGDGKFPKAYVFQTGMNQWRKFDAWPPDRGQTDHALSRCAKASSPWQRRRRLLSTNTSPIPISRCRTSGR